MHGWTSGGVPVGNANNLPVNSISGILYLVTSGVLAAPASIRINCGYWFGAVAI
jgi:hypothetical protein